jgi:hypothetical protein
MTRQEMERQCQESNKRHAEARLAARVDGAPCDVEPMLAFGGIPYCRTHGVMGECPYKVQS